jgi:NADH-quinone oxidoreductase subunit J
MGLIGLFVQQGFANAGYVRFGAFTGGSAQAIGMALFTKYLLPFEVISVLILVAILGAIVLGRKEMD